MPVRTPTLSELSRIAEHYNLQLTDDEVRSYQHLIEALLPDYAEVERFPDPMPAARYPRTSGYRPGPEENPLNAWYWRCAIRGAPEGKLAGKRIAVKDNVCVAGIPMMNGSPLLEGYVPELDATVVTRILDAGGEIAGKAVCEDLCVSGGSHTSFYGPVRNPHNQEYATGGSSSGSAALVAAGEVDMAIGGDQGGSIRMPSSWCGVVGHKPTYGLVPYTGAFPLELTLDHLGPIARTAADAALLLEAIAGRDELDPRQPAEVPTPPYTELLTEDLRGVRIGIVAEGFGWEGISEPDVDETVRQAARKLKAAHAEVVNVSVPLHRVGIRIWTTIAVEGISRLVIDGNGMGTGWSGAYYTSMFEAFARGRKANPQDLPLTGKLFVLLGDYLHEQYNGRFYAKGQNMARTLRAAYNAALADVDVLVMPTTTIKAAPLPPADISIEDYFARSSEMGQNVGQFDVTGHPAASIPCGKVDGLPVGMMLIGRHWEDATVLRVAHAFEQL
ncbi:MAG TPA: amidase [Roseiflexaceae bacterium]|nr:amidase [Roseiflexaceae bacterium]